jgi:hypothetical protein
MVLTTLGLSKLELQGGAQQQTTQHCGAHYQELHQHTTRAISFQQPAKMLHLCNHLLDKPPSKPGGTTGALTTGSAW